MSPPERGGRQGGRRRRGTSPRAEGVDARARAARVLAEVLAGRATLPESLARQPAIAEPGNAEDEAFVRELCYGSARHAFELDHEVRRHLRQAPREKDLDIHALLLIGAYQIRHLDVPDHAAVHATVAAAEALGKPWATGLLNAVLRKVIREEQTPVADLPAALRWNHPDWWLEKLQQQWPEDWEQMVAAGNARPPMTLRSRRKRLLGLAELEQAGIPCHPGEVADSAIYLHQPLPVAAIPGFQEGEFSVQDEGAQLAASLLGAAAGERLLDACAAPGGKTLHLAQMAPAAGILALDVDGRRCERIRDNLRRGQARAEVRVGDGRQPAKWWDGKPFDRILVDAPCSATGILRRQPDIRLLRRADDISELTQLQGELLRALWPLLRKGGRLLYCTCSVLREENDDVIRGLLAGHADARVLPIEAAWGRATDFGRQLLPTSAAHDGFYFCLLSKRAGEAAAEPEQPDRRP